MRDQKFARHVSPLRYPGGKARMATFLADTFQSLYNGLMDVEVWIEPFAGGGGAGLTLLQADVVEEFWMMERNPALAAFWRSLATSGEELASLVEQTVATMDLWEQSRAILANPALADGELGLGMAAFMVNRCSRSGMISPRVGPIGGKRQDGQYTLASRFDGPKLAQRLREVAALGSRIRVFEGDAIEYIAELEDSGIENEVMLFVDPPYVREGNGLYAQGMSLDEHRALAQVLRRSPCSWMLTYDDEPVVANDWYAGFPVIEFEIAHTANRQRIDWEYLVMNNVPLPGALPPLPTGTWHWLREPEEVLAVA